MNILKRVAATKCNLIHINCNKRMYHTA